MRVLAARDHGYRGAVLALLLRAAGHQAGGLDWGVPEERGVDPSPAIVVRSARDVSDAEAARLRLTVTPAGGARGG